MQSIYSWMGTDIHLMLEDEFAAAYNRAQDAFFAAQKEYREVNGRNWNPATDRLPLQWTKTEQDAWNGVAELINKLIELNGGSLDLKQEDMTSDYLIKV